jgi:tyrosinase
LGASVLELRELSAIRKIPPAFTETKLPDQSPNPLRIDNRRAAVNTNGAMPAEFASSAAAMDDDHFITPVNGTVRGFGGPKTAFHHGFDGLKGDLEQRPHDIIHGWVAGLMNNPDTAALDPIFWLHHANIDRLWETWRIQTDANPTDNTWRTRKFKLRDKSGALVQMAVSDVVDTQQLDYTYDSLPAVAAEPEERAPMPSRSKTKTIAQRTKPMKLGREGAAAELDVGALPPIPAAAAAGEGPRFYLRLADISGETNPDIIYGVYVNLPDDADDATRAQHRVGLVSFFGIEHTTKQGSKNPKPLSYSFDVTEVVSQEAAGGDLKQLRVALLPMEGTVEEPSPAAAAAPPINVGTVALNVAQ